jgi:hypothetical protein
MSREKQEKGAVFREFPKKPAIPKERDTAKNKPKNVPF